MLRVRTRVSYSCRRFMPTLSTACLSKLPIRDQDESTARREIRNPKNMQTLSNRCGKAANSLLVKTLPLAAKKTCLRGMTRSDRRLLTRRNPQRKFPSACSVSSFLLTKRCAVASYARTVMRIWKRELSGSLSFRFMWYR
jgi:hypothetical protein